MPSLRLDGVRMVYPSERGPTVAIDGLSFDIAKGEFVCIVGPSGCGKSTLLNLIAGLERPSSGRVLVADKPAGAPGPDRLIMFQEGALFPWLRVADNVAFGLKIAGVAREERRRRALAELARVGLAHHADHHLHELSVGMRQRVALARALVMRPQLLLMDEPFAALDAQTREDLYGELQRLWAETGSTVLFVTHNVREAAVLGDRVLVLSARPARIVVERRCDAPRPRHIEDAPVIELARQLHRDLRLASAGPPPTELPAAEPAEPAEPAARGGPRKEARA